jgi:hypothetical protein
VRAGATAYPVKRRLLVAVTAGRTTKVTAAYGAVLNPGVRPAPERIIDLRGGSGNPTAIVVGDGSSVPPVGSIITSGPTSSLPSGLLARVIATKHQGARVVISLTAAAVSEAAPQLSYTGSLQLKPAPGAGEQSGSSIPAETARVPDAGIASDCGPPGLVKFGAHLDSVELREAFIGVWPPQMKMTFAVRTTETLGLGLAAAGINCDFNLAEIGPWEAAIPVGPVIIPVYATLPVKASIHINGTLQAGAINVASTTVAHAAAGGDENAASVSQQGSNVWLNGVLSLSGDASLAAGIGVQAGIGIAKGANIHLEAGFGPEFEWSTGHDCELLINLGSLSAGAEVLGRSLDTPSFTPFKLHLWKGCQPAPTPPPTPPPAPPTPTPMPTSPAKPAVPATGPTLIYDGETAGHDYEGDTSFTDWAEATGQEASVQEALPTELDSYKCVALDLNQSIEIPQTEALARYVKEGGTIIVIGEHEGEGWSQANEALNQFLGYIGSELSLDDDSLDEGAYTTFNIEPSPLTSGVTDLGYDWITSVSVSGPATPLVLTEDGSSVLVGAQNIGSGTVVVSGDSNIFSDNNLGFYEYNDNGQFVRDLCP